jgi:hypothetical protein
MNSQEERWARRGVAMLAAVLLLAAPVFPTQSGGQTTPQAAANPDPAALPARDSHQGLLIAADPYLTSERSEQKFGKKHPYSAGLLAIDVYLRNDSESPLRIDIDTIELRIAAPGQRRQRLETLTVEDVAYRIVLPNGAAPRARRGPIPGVGGGKTKEIAKMEDSLRYLMLQSDMIGPHNTIHGFVIFDIARHFEDTGHSTLYIPDVSRFGSGEKLFFFEIDLRPASH